MSALCTIFDKNDFVSANQNNMQARGKSCAICRVMTHGSSDDTWVKDEGWLICYMRAVTSPNVATANHDTKCLVRTPHARKKAFITCRVH